VQKDPDDRGKLIEMVRGRLTLLSMGWGLRANGEEGPGRLAIIYRETMRNLLNARPGDPVDRRRRLAVTKGSWIMDCGESEEKGAGRREKLIRPAALATCISQKHLV